MVCCQLLFVVNHCCCQVKPCCCQLSLLSAIFFFNYYVLLILFSCFPYFHIFIFSFFFHSISPPPPVHKKKKILVCAPSNGAVDELTQRLALEGGGVWDHRGKAVAPRVVRVGRPSEGAADRVKAVTLDNMVEDRRVLMVWWCGCLMV